MNHLRYPELHIRSKISSCYHTKTIFHEAWTKTRICEPNESKTRFPDIILNEHKMHFHPNKFSGVSISAKQIQNDEKSSEDSVVSYSVDDSEEESFSNMDHLVEFEHIYQKVEDNIDTSPDFLIENPFFGSGKLD